MIELVFDFPDPDTGAPRRRVFRDPLDGVVARTAAEVRPALEVVEAGVARGLHAAGYLAYEAAPGLDPALRVHPRPTSAPLLWFGLFNAPHDTTSSEAPSSPSSSSTKGLPAAPGPWRIHPDRARHAAAVAAIREAIAEGRTYQVNYTARLRAPWNGADPAAVYEAMRAAQGPGYHARLDLGRDVILSASPELFFRTRGRSITTRPMKGTRPRGRWTVEDDARAAELASSPKDRAENLMIVDLLRNDLGRVCRTGTVRVPALAELERYRTVWQLTSTVTGELRDDVGLSDLLAALFPCGSVTGAPKISTMELIARLEETPRGVYCGAIGMVEPGGDAVFNVPIRTLRLDRETGEAEYGAGGGVVWDSTAGGEYDELLAKAAILREPWPAFELLETMAAEGGRILRLERHLARLRDSTRYFGFPWPEFEIRERLDAAAGARGAPPLRVRLTLAATGTVTVETEPLGRVGREEPGEVPDVQRPLVALAREPVSSRDRFLFHKTTHRGAYHSRLAAAPPDTFDVILHNEWGELTELTRGNLVLELDGRLLTPPRSGGLLAGCLRGELLERGVIEEATLTPDDLRRATRVWSINSARRWIEVEARAG